MGKKRWIAAVLSAVALCALALLTAGLLICNLFRFLGGAPQFQTIFAQIRNARIGPPIWLILPQFGLCFAAQKLWQNGKKGLSGCVMAAGWLLMLLCALYFTRVNGILFGDVVLSLIQVLGKGGLAL